VRLNERKKLQNIFVHEVFMGFDDTSKPNLQTIFVLIFLKYCIIKFEITDSFEKC